VVESPLLKDLWGNQEGSVAQVTLGFLYSQVYDMSEVPENIEISEYIDEL
jgi:hypothetical protein